MMIFAQGETALKTGSEFVKTASQFGADTFLTSVILLCIFALTGVYVWYVAIPNGKSHRENSEKLSSAITIMSGSTSETLEHAVVIRSTTDVSQKQIDRLIGGKLLETTILEKLADAHNNGTKVDVARDLAELRGRLA
jgi:hypothetical protein